MAAVLYGYCVKALSLQHHRRLGYHTLQNGLVTPVAGKKTFIGKSNDRLGEMRIEFSRDLLGLNDMNEMRSEQPAEVHGELALADTQSAAKRDSDPGEGGGMLNRVSHPIHQVFVII
jgi:hypothetical protein